MRELKMFGSAIKTVSLDEFFQHLEAAGSENVPEAVYKAVAWVFRCVQIRANAVSRIPYTIKRGESDVDFLPLKRLLWDTEAALCIWGAAYWLKTSIAGDLKRLQWLNPTSIEAKTSSKGIDHFEQNIAGQVKKYKVEEIVYFRSWNPTDDLGPGVAPAQVALEAAGLAKNANLWASKFFEHGAIPAIILESEGRIDPAEQKRIAGVWDEFVGGVKKAFRTLALGRGMKANIIGSPVKDVAMPELMQQVRQQICCAFGIPITLLEDSANYATAKEHRKSLYDETLTPECEVIIQEPLNEQLFGMLKPPLEFAFQFEALEVNQEEERDRAESVLQLVQAGCPLETAFSILGIDVPEGMDIGPVAPPATAQPTIREAAGLDWKPDLKLWQKKALRHLEEKGVALVPFESDRIPPWLHAGITERLADCETGEEVKEVFAGTFSEGNDVAEWRGFLAAFADFETNRLLPGMSMVQGSPDLITDGAKFWRIGDARGN